MYIRMNYMTSLAVKVLVVWHFAAARSHLCTAVA